MKESKRGGENEGIEDGRMLMSSLTGLISSGMISSGKQLTSHTPSTFLKASLFLAGTSTSSSSSLSSLSPSPCLE